MPMATLAIRVMWPQVKGNLETPEARKDKEWIFLQGI